MKAIRSSNHALHDGGMQRHHRAPVRDGGYAVARLRGNGVGVLAAFASP